MSAHPHELPRNDWRSYLQAVTTEHEGDEVAGNPGNSGNPGHPDNPDTAEEESPRPLGWLFRSTQA